MKITLRKLKTILLFFSNNVKYLGKIKLMKLFYFLDFEHTRQFGTPVTFDNYIHLAKGPIPSEIMDLIEKAYNNETSILSDSVEFITPPNTRMIKMIPVRKFDVKDAEIFSESEIKVLKEISNKYKNSTMEQIKKASHIEAPYKTTKMNQSIPYHLAAKDNKSKFTEDEIKSFVTIVG